MPLRKPGLPRAVCRRKTLLDEARDRYGVHLNDLKSLVDYARNGDDDCRKIIMGAGSIIGLALTNVVNMDSPDRIVLGGALSGAGEILLGPARAALRQRAMAAAVAKCEIVLAAKEEWSSAWGAAALVLVAPAPA